MRSHTDFTLRPEIKIEDNCQPVFRKIKHTRLHLYHSRRQDIPARTTFIVQADRKIWRSLREISSGLDGILPMKSEGQHIPEDFSGQE